MTRQAYLLTVIGSLLASLCVNVRADTLVANQPLEVKDKAPQKAYAFGLRDVRLLDSPFKAAMELDAKYLLSLEPDRFLSRFREFAGLKPKAETYGGWETATISGHSLGHYLTAVSKLYASTADKRLLDRVNYIVDELTECQKAWGNGFVGGFPRCREVFAEIKAGDIRSKGFDLNGIWVPWYNLHKLYMGLVDAYLYCGNEKTKDILTKSTDWAWDMVGGLTDEQLEKMLHCEHGGINEAFAEIYAVTGYEKALKLAERFYHHRVLDPLARQEDKLTGLHSNTQIPKLIGLARLYRLTGKDHYNTASSFFWETIVRNRTYVNGGNTDGEYFFGPKDFSKHLSVHTTETCNTHNMLKLTRQLFAMAPHARYADYYERALYNHILASQDPEQGMMIYFCPLKSGHFKTYNTPYDSFWCCTGTGMENHVKYGDSIYFYDDSTLYVNLFIPSVLNYRDKGLTVTQQTRYPLDGRVQLSFVTDKALKLTVKIRRPHWATDDVKLSVNDKPHLVTTSPGDYMTVERTWKKGDQIALVLAMKLRTEAMPDNPNKVAFFYGPVLLAGALGIDGIEDIDPHAENRGKFDQVPSPPIPVLVAGEKRIEDYLRARGEPGTFVMTGSVLRTPGVDKSEDMRLIPFYKMHYQRYMVYWDRFSQEDWKAMKDRFGAERAEGKALEARTIDHIVLGQMQPERDHEFKGENTHKGLFRNRHWRDARSGGWFSFEMKVLPDTPVRLACLYWGSDGPDRDFDILIDDKKIATEDLNQNHPGRFFTETYDIPAELTKGKTRVTVKFKAHAWRTAGGLYECRTMKK
ncbi:MAG: glycoside hydrolase family 127 protein [Planctomycetes bacterium]|nr:glycoside hydrolase family 127 protein [Planctomycetota bacterium]